MHATKCQKIGCGDQITRVSTSTETIQRCPQQQGGSNAVTWWKAGAVAVCSIIMHLVISTHVLLRCVIQVTHGGGLNNHSPLNLQQITGRQRLPKHDPTHMWLKSSEINSQNNFVVSILRNILQQKARSNESNNEFLQKCEHGCLVLKITPKLFKNWLQLGSTVFWPGLSQLACFFGRADLLRFMSFMIRP